MLYEMSHGFHITHELLVMDWHLKDISCLDYISLIDVFSNVFRRGYSQLSSAMSPNKSL